MNEVLEVLLFSLLEDWILIIESRLLLLLLNEPCKFVELQVAIKFLNYLSILFKDFILRQVFLKIVYDAREEDDFVFQSLNVVELLRVMLEWVCIWKLN
jgi:hypothetical protein